jgi:hypothetical protein
MRVRLNQGRYAGDVVDMPFTTAKTMIELGRAEPIDCLHLFPAPPAAAAAEGENVNGPAADHPARRRAHKRR